MNQTQMLRRRLLRLPRRVVWAAAAVLAVLPGRLPAQSIVGSDHDFSSRAWSTGEICLPCHTPHNADLTVRPLWNHDLSQASYDVYTSPTMDVTVGQPGTASKLCLSCHDGTVAVDAYGGAGGTEYVPAGASMGTDLRDDHPIGIAWQHQTETPSCNNCHNVKGPGLFVSVLPFPGGKVECTSCHNPHNGAGYAHFLRKTMSGSELCFHCHAK